MGAASRRRSAARAAARGLLGGLVLAATTAAPARAQLRWDASAQAGGVKRWLADRPPGGDDAGFGPSAQLAAHLALLPLVRVGAYATLDATGAGDATRAIASGGVRAKLLSPWPRGDLRGWLFAGFGVAGAFSPRHGASAEAPVDTGPGTEPRDGTVSEASGRFLEVPLGLGGALRVWGPFSLSAELAFRIGLAHAGSLYEPPGRTLAVPGRPDAALAPAGLDHLALGLTVGVLYDR